MKKAKKKVPCWVCKGKGGETEVVCDDGTGPYFPCEFCEDTGMIVIGGKKHKHYRKLLSKHKE